MQILEPMTLPTGGADAAPASWVRCGIILAGGDGTRLQPLVRRLRGDALPKQYVSFFGTRPMIEETAARARLLLPADRLFTVVSRHHLNYSEVQALAASRALGQVVLQPANKDTGPGLLLPLMRVMQRHPEAIVAVFPSDHCIEDGGLFMSYVNLAYQIVEQNPWLMVLLGVAPQRPEPEYGYIVPGAVVESGYPSNARGVRQFVEKPDAGAADALAQEGGLWNTMVMVFRANTLFRHVRETAPELAGRFRRFAGSIGSPDEFQKVEELYSGIPPMNLSRDFLQAFAAKRPSPLAVLPVRGVAWSDWGSERRILEEFQLFARLESRLQAGVKASESQWASIPLQ